MSENSRRELFVIDGAVTNNETIIQALGGRDYLILSEHNGLDEVKAYLTAKDEQYDVIHFITHGSAGALSINGETITNDSFSASDWADIGSYLTDKGDLLFYGCEIAKTADGKRLVDSIAKAAHADAAASIDLTGGHGDWELEYVSGRVESVAITVDGYEGDLRTTVTKAQTLKESTTVTDTDYQDIKDTALTIKYKDVKHKFDVTVTNCTFKNNYQGIVREENNSLTINGDSTLFEGNASKKDGAGLYTKSEWGASDQDMRGALTIDSPSTTFQYNVAGNEYAVNKQYKDNNWDEWQENAREKSSEKYGGAIYGKLENSSLSTDLKNNKACMAQQTISNATFSYNAAIGGGGAVAGDGYIPKL